LNKAFVEADSTAKANGLMRLVFRLKTLAEI
jgi:hypothetical protein